MSAANNEGRRTELEEVECNIIDLDAVRRAKQQGAPLNDELSARIERIKQSIERINKLMAGLRSKGLETQYDSNDDTTV